MNGCATKLDGDFWIENAYSGLERGEGVILVREDTKYAGFDTKANACRNVFLCGLEPGVALGLDGRTDGRTGVGVGGGWAKRSIYVWQQNNKWGQRVEDGGGSENE